VGDLLGDSETTREMLAQGSGDLADGFYATAMLTLALVASGFTISAALRARGEEDDGRVEALLATGLSRLAWQRGHLLVTGLGTLVVLLAGGLGLGIGYTLATGDASNLASYTFGTLQYAPATLVLGGLAALLHGFLPRWAGLAWAGLGLSVVVAFFGPLLGLPDWLRDLSPFEHLALVPVETFAPLAFAVVLGIAALLVLGAQITLSRRDVH